MTPVEIAPGITALGALNPDLRVFDVIMKTEFGTSYNAYLVQGREKTALIDGVKAPFSEEHRRNIASITDISKIDYIVVQHTEPDHAGSVGDLLDAAPGAQVLGSRAALMNLAEQLNRPIPGRAVAHGEEVDLGGMTLSFILAPFLHWPDTLFTWVPERNVLFTCDFLGCHYCTPDVFDDGLGADLEQAQRYYFDVIISPFADYALQAIDKIRDLPIRIFAPSHGPVLRKDPWRVVERYKEWCRGWQPENDPPRVLVAYVSAYGYTRRLAERAHRKLEDLGLGADLVEITSVSPERMLDMIHKSDGVLIGSPTFNRDALPPVWGLLTGLSHFRNRKRPFGAFGCYGWSGEAVGQIEARLKGLNLPVPVPGYRVKFQATEDNLREMDEFVTQFAQAVRKAAGKS